MGMTKPRVTVIQGGGDKDTLPPHVLKIKETVDAIRIFGILPVPQFFCKFVSTHVIIHGPQNVMFQVENGIFGKFRAFMSLTPIAPFRQRIHIRCWAQKAWPWPVARILLYLVIKTVYQDKEVWEHKMHVSPRNLVAGDGPFAG